MSTTTQNPVPSTLPKPERQLGRIEGRYASLMAELFEDVQRIFKLTPKAADKAAMAAVREFGQVMSVSNIGKGQVKLGKSNADGFGTVGEAATKVKNVYQNTPGLTLLKMVAYIDNADKHGIVKSETEWSPIESMSKWFAELESQVK